jgi:hypothetical protein
MDGLLSVVDGIDRSLFVWYDQTATVDGVKGNNVGVQQLSIGSGRW